MDAIEAWNRCLAIIRENVSPTIYADWFQQIQAVDLADHVLTIRVPSELYCEHLDEHYSKLLRAVLRTVFHGIYKQEVKLQYYYGRSETLTPEDSLLPTGEELPTHDPFVLPGVKPVRIEHNLNFNYTFENFVPSDANITAYDTGKALITRHGDTPFNPLVICGAQGLGKSHLAHAIGVAILKHSPKTTVMYIRVNEFMRKFSIAARQGTVAGFIAYYQRIDVLIIDDIQDIANGKKSQEILYNIFDYLHSHGKQLIFTSAIRINELQNVRQDLISRFKWGMITEVKMPDEETRLSILRKKLQSEISITLPCAIPEEILRYIAKRVTSDVRELIGVATSLISHATAKRCQIDLPFTKEILESMIKPREEEKLTIKRVLDIVADYFALTPDDILSASRKREIAEARQIGIYMAKKYTHSSNTAIGRVFNRNHATVTHACKTVNDLCLSNPRIRMAVSDLDARLQLYS